MKIAILGDTHFGARNASKIFDDQSREFFTNRFFPELRERNVNTIIQVGDLFDNRKSIDLTCLHSAREYFFKPLREFDFATLVGNHDSVYKNTLEINSQSLLMENHHSHTIIDTPMHIGAGLALPWICKQNYDDFAHVIANSTAQYVFGHLELSGFKNNSHVMKDGLSHTVFKKFKRVFTGHYHNRQSQDNILYVGTPYELSWSDYGDTKGFHILDTDSGELEFIENPDVMHMKIQYSPTQDNQAKIGNITNKIVRVIVDEKGDQKSFDKFIDGLNSMNPYELKISDASIVYDEEKEDIDLDIDSTPVIIDKYIDNCDISLDKNILKDMFKELYSEAILL